MQTNCDPLLSQAAESQPSTSSPLFKPNSSKAEASYNQLACFCTSLLSSVRHFPSPITNKPTKICKTRFVVILSFNSLISFFSINAFEHLLILLIFSPEINLWFCWFSLGFILKNLGTLPGTCDYLHGFGAQMMVTHLIVVW